MSRGEFEENKQAILVAIDALIGCRQPRLRRMNNPSPGLGWWLASDGKWYPQKWEYDAFRWSDQDQHALITKLRDWLDEKGQLGWELVSASMVTLPARG